MKINIPNANLAAHFLDRFKYINHIKITKIALIPALKCGVFDRAIFWIENCRTKVRGVKNTPYALA